MVDSVWAHVLPWTRLTDLSPPFIERHCRIVSRTASQLFHFENVYLWCITSWDSHMDAEFTATRQTSTAAIDSMLLRGCISPKLALVTSFLLDDLQPCEWLSPHILVGNCGRWSRCNSPNVSSPYHLYQDILSCRLTKGLHYNAPLKKFVSVLAFFETLTSS